MPDDRLDEALAALRDELADQESPVTTAPAVAERLDRDRRRVHDDLEVLERAGDADSLRVGARARVWWPTPHPWRETPAAPPQRREERVEPAPDPVPDPDPPAVEDDHNADEIDPVVERVSEGWDEDHRLEDRRAAAQAGLELFRERGSLGKSDATDALLPEYDVDGQNETTWWKQNLRPVLQEVGTYSHGDSKYVE